jgi:hypothetical protein
MKRSHAWRTPVILAVLFVTMGASAAQCERVLATVVKQVATKTSANPAKLEVAAAYFAKTHGDEAMADALEREAAVAAVWDDLAARINAYIDNKTSGANVRQVIFSTACDLAIDAYKGEEPDVKTVLSKNAASGFLAPAVVAEVLGAVDLVEETTKSLKAGANPYSVAQAARASIACAKAGRDIH